MKIFEEENIGRLDFEDKFIQKQSKLIIDCYKLTFGKNLIEVNEPLSACQLARQLFLCPLGILSHNIVNGDNIYNYANRAALHIFERTYKQQTNLPSSKSAVSSAVPQLDRNNLLAQCLFEGSADVNVSRLTGNGRTVHIKDGELFNLADERGVYRGQAICIDPEKISYGE